MKKIFLILSIITVAISSCTKDDNEKVYTGTANLTPTQVVPAAANAGTGTISYAYNQNNRTFTYQVNFANLTDSCTQIGIARAPIGQAVPSSIFQLSSFNGVTTLQRRLSGTINGNFVVDGQAITLADLLAGKYCVFLRRRVTSTTNVDEIRGQITF
jgi:hypothetical protein